MFEDEEIIRIVLSRIHDDYIWLDKHYLILKEVWHVVTWLCLIGQVPKLKYVNNVEVNWLIRVISNGRASRIISIRDVDVKYATMGINHTNFIIGIDKVLVHLQDYLWLT